MANLVKYAAHLLIVTAILFHSSSFAKQAAVAMPDSYSSDTARSILEQGGNAVDAAIAAQFVLAVTLPEAGNIGGGGFMLIQKDGKGDFIDYRETAPAAAHRDMYLDDKGDVIDNMSVYGIHASGVPGSVAGMWLAHQKHGSLEWKTLLEPAVKLAEQGFIVHPKLAASIERYIARMAKKSVNINFADYFADAKANKVFKQPELAATLKRIRDQGKAGFYEGETAKIIVPSPLLKYTLLTNSSFPILSIWPNHLKVLLFTHSTTPHHTFRLKSLTRTSPSGRLRMP